MRVLTDYETALIDSFGRKRVFFPNEKQIDTLHAALKNYNGTPYTPPKKPCADKIADVLRLHEPGSEWDIKTVQRHLYFFNQKTYSSSTISRCLKKLEAKGLLEKVDRGIYRKAA